MAKPVIKVKLINEAYPVEVTSIDFRNSTITWDFRGRYENTESFSDIEKWEFEEE